MLARIADRFGSRLHAPATELVTIGRHAHVDIALGRRHVDANGVEVISDAGPYAGQ